MSTTMRPTLQTVPESLPADHVTVPTPAPATTTATPAPSQPRHPRPMFKNDQAPTDENLPPNKQHQTERRISRSSISSLESPRDFSPASDNDPSYLPSKPSTAKRRRSDTSSSSSSSSTSSSNSSSSSSSSASSSSSSERHSTNCNQCPSLATLASAAIDKITTTTTYPNDSTDCNEDGALESNNLKSISKPTNVNALNSMAKESRTNSQKKIKGTNKKKTAQTLRNLGKSYVSSSSKNVPERVMGGPCNDKCRLNCHNVITQEDRIKIFRSYWNLGSLSRQRDYIAKNLVNIFPKYQYKKINSNRKPKNAFHFEINGIRTRVCKIFFKNTLGIGDRPIRTVLDKKNEQGVVDPEKRGKHGNKKTISEEALTEVRHHIDSIPRIESHYLRKQTSRQFIDGGKTLADLYRDYKLECTKKNVKFVQIHIYRKVFKTEYNISFFVPKKDQCDLCTAYKIADIKDNLIDKYQSHLKEKDESRIEKEKDKKINNCIVSCYDLQAVMTVPKGDISIFYYKSKLNCLNFTISELGKDHTECFFWTEVEGQRGVNEIATCVFKYLVKMSSLHPNFDFIFYSDNCCGQQKNQFMLSLYLYALKTLPINSITHKFLIKGHTQNEGDAIHSTIEKEVKKMLKSGPIYVPDQYIAAIKNARKKGNSYIVNLMSHGDFYDIKSLSETNFSKNTQGEKIKLGDVKIIKIVKDLNEPTTINVFYKNSYLDKDFKEIRLEVNRVATRRQHSAGSSYDVNANNPLKPLYTSKLPLGERKRNDIKSLIDQNLIPSYYVSSYYDSIL